MTAETTTTIAIGGNSDVLSVSYNTIGLTENISSNNATLANYSYLADGIAILSVSDIPEKSSFSEVGWRHVSLLIFHIITIG